MKFGTQVSDDTVMLMKMFGQVYLSFGGISDRCDQLIRQIAQNVPWNTVELNWSYWLDLKIVTKILEYATFKVMFIFITLSSLSRSIISTNFYNKMILSHWICFVHFLIWIFFYEKLSFFLLYSFCKNINKFDEKKSFMQRKNLIGKSYFSPIRSLHIHL